MVTFVIAAWKRYDNLDLIINTIKSQYVDCKIFIWDNSCNYKNKKVDWIVHSSQNYICWPRWWMATFADTKYVCIMDDDINLSDKNSVSLCIQEYEKYCDNCFLGPIGVNITCDNYMRCPCINGMNGRSGYVDFLKGRFVFFERDYLKLARFQTNIKRHHMIGEDMIFASLVDKHYVSSLFEKIVYNLSEGAEASSMSKDHYDVRNEVMNQYYAHKIT